LGNTDTYNCPLFQPCPFAGRKFAGDSRAGIGPPLSAIFYKKFLRQPSGIEPDSKSSRQSLDFVDTASAAHRRLPFAVQTLWPRGRGAECHASPINCTPRRILVRTSSHLRRSHYRLQIFRRRPCQTSGPALRRRRWNNAPPSCGTTRALCLNAPYVRVQTLHQA